MTEDLSSRKIDAFLKDFPIPTEGFHEGDADNFLALIPYATNEQLTKAWELFSVRIFVRKMKDKKAEYTISALQTIEKEQKQRAEDRELYGQEKHLRM